MIKKISIFRIRISPIKFKTEEMFKGTFEKNTNINEIVVNKNDKYPAL
ncbi:hypothetical protein [Clostridium ihumii]